MATAIEREGITLKILRIIANNSTILAGDLGADTTKRLSDIGVDELDLAQITFELHEAFGILERELVSNFHAYKGLRDRYGRPNPRVKEIVRYIQSTVS